MRLTQEQFEQAVRGSRMKSGAVEAGRRLLVDGEAPNAVAQELQISRQRAHAIKARILERYKAASLVKVTAEEYMVEKPQREALLATFAGELLQLQRHGYTVEHMQEYLRKNGVEATPSEIEAVVSERKGGK